MNTPEQLQEFIEGQGFGDDVWFGGWVFEDGWDFLVKLLNANTFFPTRADGEEFNFTDDELINLIAPSIDGGADSDFINALRIAQILWKSNYTPEQQKDMTQFFVKMYEQSGQLQPTLEENVSAYNKQATVATTTTTTTAPPTTTTVPTTTTTVPTTTTTVPTTTTTVPTTTTTVPTPIETSSLDTKNDEVIDEKIDLITTNRSYVFDQFKTWWGNVTDQEINNALDSIVNGSLTWEQAKESMGALSAGRLEENSTVASTGDPVLDSVKAKFPQLTPEQLSSAVAGIKAGDFNIAELEALFYTLNNPVTPEEIFAGDPVLSEIMAAYASEFGYFGSFLEHTQVAPILLLASEEKWTAAKLNQELKRPDLDFAVTKERLNALTEHGYDVSGMKEKVEAELASTDSTIDRSWWRNTLDTERAWQMLLASDPAVAEKQKLDQINILRVAAGNLRINLSPERLETLAVDAITQGWEGADYGRNLLAEASWDEGKAAVGAIGANMNKINNLANDYMLTYSPGVVEDWARKIYLGEETLNILEADFIQTAKEMYPTMAEKLDRGYNTRELFDPYAQKIANLLEVPATSIDFINDPKYSPIIDSVTDTGERRAMTLSETAEYIRTSPLTKDLWGKTSQAKTAAQGFADFVAKKFGGLG